MVIHDYEHKLIWHLDFKKLIKIVWIDESIEFDIFWNKLHASDLHMLFKMFVLSFCPTKYQNMKEERHQGK